MAAQEDAKDDERVFRSDYKIAGEIYYIYGDEDQNNVIELCERSVFKKDHLKANLIAAATTALILSDIEHYSNIQDRRILRGYGNKGKE
jgi:hypothetical protein